MVVIWSHYSVNANRGVSAREYIKYSTLLQGSDVVPRALLIKRKIQLVAQARLEKGLMAQGLLCSLCRVHVDQIECDNTMAK